MKNPKPTLLAFISAIVVAIVASLLTFIFSSEAKISILVFLTSIISGYFTFLYILQNFIYRKIKLVYKSIHQLKAGSDEISLKQKLSDDPLEMVNKEVLEWENEKLGEIEQLKKLEIYRKEFVANVTHELKTPLFSIQGYIHTLLDGALHDEEVNKMFLEKAARNVDRLTNLIADLEAITQLESGSYTLEKEVFDIHSLVKDVIESLEMKADKRRISLAFKKGCDKPFYVFGDKDKVRQVLINLIDNSIKYGKENGNTIISFYDMDENILTEITDDGNGIEEHHLNRLFERFYRADKSRSREIGGTGLGLSIVKHIIEAHDKTINVRSRVGVGTTFGFTLEKK
ncbi:MAG TPA: two-component sensor histidine kinase [Bacteroidetes bacterium]|nr:two-component sensor histidine kinase [Bacteroidota bacterium]